MITAPISMKTGSPISHGNSIARVRTPSPSTIPITTAPRHDGARSQRAFANKASAAKKIKRVSVSTRVAMTICTGLTAAAKPAGIANRRSSVLASAAMVTQVIASRPHWLSTGHSGDAPNMVMWADRNSR